MSARPCNLKLERGLLQRILSYLEEPRDLVSCMAVNSDWFGAVCTVKQLNWQSPSASCSVDEVRLLRFLRSVNKWNAFNWSRKLLEALSFNPRCSLCTLSLGAILDEAGESLQKLNIDLASQCHSCLTTAPLLLFELAARFCPQLESFTFNGSGLLTVLEDRSLLSNFQTSPLAVLSNLRSLHLSMVSFSTESTLGQILKRLPHLQILNLRCIFAPSPLVVNSDSLEELNISDFLNWEELKIGAPQLRVLRISADDPSQEVCFEVQMAVFVAL